MCPFLTTIMSCLKSILVETWEERGKKKKKALILHLLFSSGKWVLNLLT